MYSTIFNPRRSLAVADNQKLLVFLAPVAVLTGYMIAGTDPRFTAAGIMAVLMLALGYFAVGRRVIPIIGLVFSIPFHVVHHFTYIPDYIGSSNGLTLELTDIWVAWLAAEYAFAVWTNTHKKVFGLAGILAPAALLLVADTLSICASNDVTLSIYGAISHVRVVITFLVFAATLAQDADNIKAAALGIKLAVLTIGGICIAEAIVGYNFGAGAGFDPGTEDLVFRSAGINTPTLTAGYLAVLLPLIVVELIRRRGTAKALAATALAVGIAGLACTLTRGVWGCLAVGFIPLAVRAYRRRSIRRWHIVFGIGVAMCGLILMGARIRARLDEGAQNLNERGGLLDTALNMSAAFPVVGAGINTYWSRMYEFTDKTQSQDFVYVVHNQYALTLAETGPLGLAAFLWLLGQAVRRARRLSANDLLIGAGLLGSIVVCLLDMMIESYPAGAVLLNLWVVIAMITAEWSSRQNREGQVCPSASLLPRPKPAPARLGIAG